MPEEFEKCVRGLMNDPKFKPQNEGESKKDAAYAICVAQYKKRHGGKSPLEKSEYDKLTFEELYKKDSRFRLAVIMLDLTLED